MLQDPFLGYFEELTETRRMLDSRYDDLKGGRVKPIGGDEMKARLRARSAAAIGSLGRSKDFDEFLIFYVVAAVRDATISTPSTLVTQTCFRTADGEFHGFEPCPLC